MSNGIKRKLNLRGESDDKDYFTHGHFFNQRQKERSCARTTPLRRSFREKKKTTYSEYQYFDDEAVSPGKIEKKNEKKERPPREITQSGNQ